MNTSKYLIQVQDQQIVPSKIKKYTLSFYTLSMIDPKQIPSSKIVENLFRIRLSVRLWQKTTPYFNFN